MRIHRLRRERNLPSKFISSNKLGLALIPRIQDLSRGCAAKDTRMNEPSEFHMRDVPRGAEYALKVPDRFRRRRVDLVEEAAAVRLVEDTRETPGLVFEGLGAVTLISILILILIILSRSCTSPLCLFTLRCFLSH